MIDTINGARTSAIIYSIVETAKANQLKPFDYVQYLLEEIPQHMEDTDYSFLKIFFHGQKNFRQKFAKFRDRRLLCSRRKMSRYLLFGVYDHLELYIQ